MVEEIKVKEVISDYKDLKISEIYRYDKDRVVKGLVHIFANHGLTLRFTVPETTNFKNVKQHYSEIVKQITWNSKHKKAADFRLNGETIFYSPTMHSDLCIVDHELRYENVILTY